MRFFLLIFFGCRSGRVKFSFCGSAFSFCGSAFSFCGSAFSFCGSAFSFCGSARKSRNPRHSVYIWCYFIWMSVFVLNKQLPQASNRVFLHVIICFLFRTIILTYSFSFFSMSYFICFNLLSFFSILFSFAIFFLCLFVMSVFAKLN